MGTGARVRFFRKSEVLLCVSHAHDGYLRGRGSVGEDLAKFLLGFIELRSVNTPYALRTNDSLNFKRLSPLTSGSLDPFKEPSMMGKVANGAGCLAAQYILSVKKTPGEVYLEDAKSYPEEEYCYDVTLNDGQDILVSVSFDDKEFENLTPSEFAMLCESDGKLTNPIRRSKRARGHPAENEEEAEREYWRRKYGLVL